MMEYNPEVTFGVSPVKLSEYCKRVRHNLSGESVFHICDMLRAVYTHNLQTKGALLFLPFWTQATLTATL